jgi:hypothetical protein
MKFPLALSMLFMSVPLWAQTAPTTQPSNTESAMRKIEVTGNVSSIDSYLNAAATEVGMRVVGNAIMPNTEGYNWATIRRSPDGSTIVLNANLEGMRPVAREFLDSVVDYLQRTMEADWQQARDRRVKEATAIRDLRQREQEDVQQKMDTLRLTLRTNTGRVDVTPQALRDAMGHLQDELQKTELDLRGKEARAAALAKSIAELSVQMEASTKQDDVLSELQMVVDAREKQLELTKKNAAAGVSTPLDVQQAAALAAEARAKVAERKRDALASAGGDTLQAMNRELRMLSIDRAEQSARLDLLTSELKHIGDSSNTIDRYEQTLKIYPEVNERALAANRSLEETLAHEDQSIRPEVHVIASEDHPVGKTKASSNSEDSTHPATEK